MKRILFIVVVVICAGLNTFAQDLDSLYNVFENSKGETAYKAALTIDEAIGREPNFDADTDKDEIKLKLLRTMILHYFNNNDFQHVVQYSEIGIAHYDKIGDHFNEAGCTMTLANAYQRLGQLDKAIECYNRCNELMDQIGGEMAEVNKRYVINNIAEIHLSMGEYETAEEMYRKCIEMLRTIDVNDTASNLDLATYYQNLAEVRIAQDNPEAVGFAEQSLELSRKYQDTPHKIINRLMALSKAYRIVGRDDESAALMDEALSIAKQNGETFLETSIYLQKGDFTKAITMADENHYNELLQEALEGAYHAERERNPKLALEYFERSMVMKDSVFNENQQQLIRDYQVRYDMQEKEHALAMEQEKSKRNRMYVIVLAVVAALLLLIAFIWYRLAQIRKKRNEELAHLNATKDRLLSIVSHDVRTPVGAMCQVMRDLTDNYDGMAETDRKAKMVMLRTSSEALNDRMENIIQWVKGELENSHIVPINFNLSELVDECIKEQEMTIVAKSLKVNNEVPKTLMAHDDANVVRLVMQNLLSNAVKFSYPDGEVNVKAEKKNGRIWIEVSDNGMGISEKKLEKIFKFMTSSASGTSGETGTGIGLFVSKMLVEKIGGEITIDSRKDEGTTVRFSVKQ
ncbi:MAG: tetratricopeptide repeat-containing sensor histidine kinase [Bacteroidales bacterium]|nr:tetratricopeptide repeat-containing sensor histidine kinase [Bacteroidales bacterium]MBQ6101439.1 tetratricopeptide repeat-containing sensor histidine kinase [Bacteroidales bacterium]MBR0540158.1 tetratricopeptide repeat-containing sensor histidine kinase [Bacteroidales bacterium]